MILFYRLQIWTEFEFKAVIMMWSVTLVTSRQSHCFSQQQRQRGGQPIWSLENSLKWATSEISRATHLKILYTVLQTVLECGKTYHAYNQPWSNTLPLLRAPQVTKIFTASRVFPSCSPTAPQLLPRCCPDLLEHPLLTSIGQYARADKSIVYILYESKSYWHFIQIK